MNGSWFFVKRASCSLLLFLFFCGVAGPQESIVSNRAESDTDSPQNGKELLRFKLSEQYIRVVREDLRVYKNSAYQGFLYREQRAYLYEIDPSIIDAKARAFESSEAESGRYYRGDVYLLKEMSRNAMSVAKPVDAGYSTTLWLSTVGATRFLDSRQVPFRTNYPFLPEEPVEPGESWDHVGREYLLDEGGELMEAPFRCRYTYQGYQEHMGRPARLIQASYSYYDLNPYSDPKRVKVRGKLDASILLYTDERGGYFIRERVERYLLNTADGQRHETGFRLIWGEGFSNRHIDSMESRIAEVLGVPTEGSDDRGDGKDRGNSSEEEGEGGIEMSRTEEGVLLNLPNIHFVPDQARILPDEKDRLDTLARLLRKVPEASFLVKGHTADVGSEESQVALSEERAKTIIDELVDRGFAPNRFIYRGLGGSEPVAPNDSEEGRAKNRRVEIIVLPK